MADDVSVLAEDAAEEDVSYLDTLIEAQRAANAARRDEVAGTQLSAEEIARREKQLLLRQLRAEATATGASVVTSVSGPDIPTEDEADPIPAAVVQVLDQVVDAVEPDEAPPAPIVTEPAPMSQPAKTKVEPKGETLKSNVADTSASAGSLTPPRVIPND